MKQEVKDQVQNKYRLHDKDSGSIELQVALLTERIKDLNEQHLAQNPKDQSARFGLMKLVGRRRSFLDYLKRTSEESYYTLIDRLNIRK